MLPVRGPTVLFACLAVCCGQQVSPGDEATKTPSDFVRFVKVGDGGHLDTAITKYRRGEVELTLFAAVHIADRACYDALNDRFPQCDALLYELVGPEDYRPRKDRDREGFNPIGLLQQGLKNSLELQFQLDAVDYSPANFVHADMTPAEFEASMAERGESLLSIMLDMMMSGMKAQLDRAEDGAEAAPSFDLVKAFRSGEGRHALRMAFASQLEDMEALAAGGKGGTLLEGRNEKCLRVLEREIAAGRKKLGIYYGAAHFTHMEKRLVDDMGFKKTGQEWIVAWDCAKRPDVKYDRALIKLRQQCREQLGVLAAAARAYRLDERAEEPVPVATLAKQGNGGAARYAGPAADPWGHPWVIRKRPSGSRWEVVSAAQDGVLGTDDDMVEQEPRGR